MKNKPPVDLTPEESLHAENELKALHLELQHGASTFIADGAPPELIAAWLDNVTVYEDQYQDAARISVFDFLGRPVFATPDLLEAGTRPGEIERLTQLLETKGILVLRPDYVNDEGYYQFLITDVLSHEIPDLHLPGMVTVLDYEEFHPNHPEIIRLHAEEFLLDLLNLARPYEGLWLSEHLRNDTDTITKGQALQTIEAFRAAYREIVPIGFSPRQTLNEEHGTFFLFGICWEGLPQSGGARERHEDIGVIQMGYEEKVWLVQGVSMPGFKF